VAVTAYVTTETRLKLYEYLSELGEYVLYCDTDSVILIQNVDEPPKVRTGDYLGHLKTSCCILAVNLSSKYLCRVDQKTMRFLFSAPRQENVRPNVT